MSLEIITNNVTAGKANIEKILREGYINNFETVQRTKSGKDLVIEVNASIIDYKGRKAILSLNHDITQRKKAEENALKLSKAVVQSPVSIVITDNKSNIEFVNPMFTRVTGYTAEEVIGKKLSILKSGYHSNEFYKNLWDTLLSGKDFIGEMYNKKKNGEFFWENAFISPILNESGDITHFIAVKEDITEKKKHLEEITAAKERAEEMNRLKTTFLTNMSHELRTPLIGLLGLSEAMLDELEGDLKESMDMINQSGQRLLRTLSTILDYSKIESEKIEIAVTEVTIEDLLKNQVKLYQAFARKKGVSIIENFELSDAKILTDEKLLYDIINNLLNNAVKFTSRGTVTLSAFKDEKYLTIKVADTGIGIAKDKLEIVFEEFRQASEGTSRSFEGTGLGLAIAKKYTLLLNGNINVVSKVGKGSIFTVKLPLNPGNVSHDISNNKPKLPDHKLQKEGFKKVLLVEDDSISRKTIGKMLENDYYIVSVNNAKDAIKNAKNEIYDAILMDINLGRGMDGIQATKVIRKINGYESIPIIAMTAYAMEKDKEEFLRCGCSHYIAKPFSIKEILAYLERVLTNQLKNRKN
jgi:PAS domain S-box-containing protein